MYIVYLDSDKSEHRFYRIPKSVLALLKIHKSLKYLGMVILSDSDFPIKYPLFNQYNVRIDNPKQTIVLPKVAPQKIEICVSEVDPKRKKKKFLKATKTRKNIRSLVLKRDGNKCLKCGEPNALTMDHVVPESKGGKFTLQNLQTLCVWCNEEKADKTIDYR